MSSPEDLSARGPKYLSALSSLPEQLRPVYKDMVEEYRFYAFKRFGKAWVAYDVMADLVKAGWRLDPSAIVSGDEAEKKNAK